jgi:hypothetical protein
MKTPLLGGRDIRTPADPQDKQTTDARSALPPVEFQVSAGVGANTLSITDRQGVADRKPTSSYRIYFLPKAFMPTLNGVSATIRAAGKNVATFVTEVPASGRNQIITASDATNFGSSGHYYCVAVNRVGVEAPPQHIVAAP